jgi:hypothetical protein
MLTNFIHLVTMPQPHPAKRTQRNYEGIKKIQLRLLWAALDGVPENYTEIILPVCLPASMPPD